MNGENHAIAEERMREEHIAWILSTLKTALRLLEITNREVEERLGWSHGYLSRLIYGTIQLRFDHLFGILEVVGLHPAEFLDLAWPVRPEPPSPAAATLRQLLRRYQTLPSPLAPGPPTDLRQAMLEFLHAEIAAMLRETQPKENQPQPD